MFIVKLLIALLVTRSHSRDEIFITPNKIHNSNVMLNQLWYFLPIWLWDNIDLKDGVSFLVQYFVSLFTDVSQSDGSLGASCIFCPPRTKKCGWP